MAAVLDQVGLSRARVYALVAQNRFPKPRLVEGRSLWVQSEVDAWVIDKRDNAPVVGTVAGRLAAETKKAA